MQIFTTEMTLELIKQIKEVSSLLFEAVLLAAWSSAIDSLASIVSAISSHDWSGALPGVFVTISGTILLYRLVRANLLPTLETLFDR